MGSSSSAVPLTSYILIALLETGLEISSAVLDKAKVCLDTKGDDTIYTSALKSYAWALLGDQVQAGEAIEAMMKQANRTDDALHWEVGKPTTLIGCSSPSSTIGSSYGLPCLGPDTKALNVETTAYMILALLRHKANDSTVILRQAVKWLALQRNGNGGFVSTQVSGSIPTHGFVDTSRHGDGKLRCI